MYTPRIAHKVEKLISNGALLNTKDKIKILVDWD